jgi:RTX calcium-binding nonapeptide repeat (4 copies)
MKQGVAAKLLVATCLMASIALAGSSPAAAQPAAGAQVKLVQRHSGPASASQTITELVYTGTAVNNRVSTWMITDPSDGTTYFFTRDVVVIATAPPCFHHQGEQQTSVCPVSGIQALRFDLGGGSDSFATKLSFPMVAIGGPGNDSLSTGRGFDLLQGGAGGDRLAGGGSADSAIGGAGNDRLAGGAGKDRCQGGQGRGDRAQTCEKVGGVP